ncbi:MAG: division/cell wall cluster transcriptional repressor MraZ [Pseudomonadota bacterium]
MSEFEGYSGQGYSPAGDKGRFVLPPDFRKAVKESSGGQKILCLTKHDRWKCLVGFGTSRHSELDAQLDREEANALQAGKEFDRELKSMRMFGYKKLSFDDSGRFILPESLRLDRKITDGIFFQGAGRFFTIWAPEVLANMPAEWEDIQTDCRDLIAEAEAKAAKKGGAK